MNSIGEGNRGIATSNFNEGDKVRLKTDILMPNVPRGVIGVVESVDVDDIYPVNVLFEGYLDYGSVPCWDHELALVESPTQGESTDKG